MSACMPWALCLAALLAGAARAGPPGVAAACGGASYSPDPWSARQAAIDHHGRLPLACLQALVRECSEAAGASFLDAGSAAVCSIRYEALLRHGFGGDFNALLAWWRAAR